MEEYVLVMWPESQHLMDQEWFDECTLALGIESSAYFVPKERYNNLIQNKKVKVYITVRGGLVESVGSNTNIEYCIVDYDNHDGNMVLGVSKQDYTSPNFYDQFDVTEEEIRDELVDEGF